MKENLKELIVDSTISLIIERGEPSLREISLHAGVSLGLINYYFDSREKLIREAVRTHINNNVISSYSENFCETNETMSIENRVTDLISGILDYIINNQNLARISILNDLKYPIKNDNSYETWEGIKNSMEFILKRQIESEEKISIWHIVGSIHEAFLRPAIFQAQTGLLLTNKKDRSIFAKHLARTLLSSNSKNI